MCAVILGGWQPLARLSTQLTVTMTSTSLGLTRVLAVLGMVASSLALAPVLYTHLTHRDHSTLLPWLSELQVITNDQPKGDKDKLADKLYLSRYNTISPQKLPFFIPKNILLSYFFVII